MLFFFYYKVYISCNTDSYERASVLLFLWNDFKNDMKYNIMD